MAGLHQHLPPLGALVHFEAAARLGNFSRAADELHYSQATVSRRINELEADLGVTLFERRRHDVVLTRDGEQLATTVRSVLRELSTAADIIRQRSSDTSTLTIFTDLSLATALVSPIIGDYQRMNPELTIRVLSSFEPIETTSEKFDVGLQYGLSSASSHVVRPIADDAVMPVCSPSFANKLAKAVTPTTLTDLPLLHVAYNNTDWTDWTRFLEFAGVESKPTADGLTFSSYLVCLEVAERGEGVALGWERTVQPKIDAGTLVPLTDIRMPHPDIITAYLPSVRATNPHADTFLSMFSSRIEPLATS